jgi:hypothetical protein
VLVVSSSEGEEDDGGDDEQDSKSALYSKHRSGRRGGVSRSSGHAFLVGMRGEESKEAEEGDDIVKAKVRCCSEGGASNLCAQRGGEVWR